MNTKTLIGVLTAFSLAAGVGAQTPCPRTTAAVVPVNAQYGAAIACAGLTYSVGGLTLSTATGCPLFVTIEPRHDTAQPTKAETKAEIVNWTAGKIVYFRCRISYLIFIPISSTCEYDRDVNFGAFPLMQTTPCTISEG